MSNRVSELIAISTLLVVESAGNERLMKMAQRISEIAHDIKLKHRAKKETGAPQEEGIVLALNAIKACSVYLKTAFYIRFSPRTYKSAIKTCSVRFGNKSFNKRGDDCIFEAIRECITWIVHTYQGFDEIKKQLKEIEGYNKKFCHASSFDKKSFLTIFAV